MSRPKSEILQYNKYAIQAMKDELDNVKFVLILVDALNHKAIKLVPIIVRCFSTTTDIKNKLLEF